MCKKNLLLSELTPKQKLKIQKDTKQFCQNIEDNAYLKFREVFLNDVALCEELLRQAKARRKLLENNTAPHSTGIGAVE